MSATRFTYQRLVELVDGDRELISHLVEEGLLERRDEDRALSRCFGKTESDRCRHRLSHGWHLCRCGTYMRIRAGIHPAAELAAQGGP